MSAPLLRRDYSAHVARRRSSVGLVNRTTLHPLGGGPSDDDPVLNPYPQFQFSEAEFIIPSTEMMRMMRRRLRMACAASSSAGPRRPDQRDNLLINNRTLQLRADVSIAFLDQSLPHMIHGRISPAASQFDGALHDNR